MALVAYSDESDISDTEETESEQQNCPTRSIQVQESSKNHIQNKETSNVAVNKIPFGIDSIIDEDEEFALESNADKENASCRTNAKSGFLSSLPDAHPLATREVKLDIDENSDVVDDVPTSDTWEVTRQIANDVPCPSKDSTSKSKDKKLRFILPSLSEFADEEDEADPVEPPKKHMKPSASGTGLFALLPSPKGITRPNQLIPKIISRPKPSQKPKKQTTKKIADPDDGDEETVGSSDFFSLSEPISKLSQSEAESAKFSKTGPAFNIAPSDESSDHHPINPQNESTIIPPMESHARNSYVDDSFLPLNDVSSDVSIGPERDNVIDTDALLRLAGRRNKGEIINLVEVKADDELMSREEWMTKSLTEEKPRHSFSRKKDGMPSQQQRRKHQITYLAHQAKEKELELKTTWSQNKLTKMQTQARYGF